MSVQNEYIMLGYEQNTTNLSPTTSDHDGPDPSSSKQNEINATTDTKTVEPHWGIMISFILFSIFLFYFDILSDLGVGTFYLCIGILNSEQYTILRGSLILVFAISSIVIMGYANYNWDRENSTSSDNPNRIRKGCGPKEFLRYPLSYPFKLFSAFKIARKGRRERNKIQKLKKIEDKSTNEETSAEMKKYEVREKSLYRKAVEKENDAHLLRIFDVYFESAPQLILQVYTMLQIYVYGGVCPSPFLFVSVALSFLSIACAMTEFLWYIRKNSGFEINIAVVLFVLLPWQSCMIVSRVLSMVLLLQVSILGFFIFITSMWAILFVYFLVKPPEFTEGKSKSVVIFYYIVLTGVFMFNFVSLKDGSTRVWYVVFYIYFFTTNVIMLLLAYFLSSTSVNFVCLILGIVSISCFFLGLCFMLSYYTVFHPTKRA